MAKPSVCAVVVTYHPDDTVVQNLREIALQVSGLVVVDNSPMSSDLGSLRNCCSALSCALIENGTNQGIAEALNQGIRSARGMGYEWVILFDQDSTITDSLIDNMFRAWHSHPEKERVASIHPHYVDPITGIEPKVRRAKDGGPIVSLTSGQLLPCWIFDRIGWFASNYFIDSVDHEYCLRIRAAGYLIMDSRSAVLLHSAGRPAPARRFLGLRFRPTNHTVERRYYMWRNRIVLYRTYFAAFPVWVLQLMYEALRDTLKCFLSEEQRAQKLKILFRSTWDALNGRMGKRQVP